MENKKYRVYFSTTVRAENVEDALTQVVDNYYPTDSLQFESMLTVEEEK